MVADREVEPSSSAPNGLLNIGEETWRPGPRGFTLLEEEHLHMPEGDLFLFGIIWWNAATKSVHGMKCQNRLPYTCDVKGVQNDITMNWDGKQFVIDEVETSKREKICLAEHPQQRQIGLQYSSPSLVLCPFQDIGNRALRTPGNFAGYGDDLADLRGGADRIFAELRASMPIRRFRGWPKRQKTHATWLQPLKHVSANVKSRDDA